MGIKLFLSSARLTVAQSYNVPRKAQLIMLLSPNFMRVQLITNDCGRTKETTSDFLNQFDRQLYSMGYFKESLSSWYTFIPDK